MSVIADIEVHLFKVPLPRPWGPLVHQNYLVTCKLRDSEGYIGTGFTWTPQVGARAIATLLVHDCRDLIRGWPTHPAVVWDRLWRSLHEAGGGGITTLAIAAIDTALWDLTLRRSSVTLGQHLGMVRKSVRAYGSGINYDDDLETLSEQARRWVNADYHGVKIKVGHPSLQEDIRRCQIVREIIGPERRLMIDANQRWSLDQAMRAIDALSQFDIHWVEEPILADDIEGYQVLRSRVRTPLAMGENQRTIFEFRRVLSLRACDVIQPNVARVGGITPFLRIASFGQSSGVRVCPHHLPEISAQLAMCLSGEEMIEDIEDSSFVRLGILKSASVELAKATVRLREELPGIGIDFDFDRLAEFAVD